MTQAPFPLPLPWPEGLVFLDQGRVPAPASFFQKSRRCFRDPAEALDWLKTSGWQEGSPPTRLVIVHQDAFAGEDGGHRFCAWLTALREMGKPCLAILLHAGLPADQLVGFFRCGLFDAVRLPLEGADWINLLIRAEKRLEWRHQSHLIIEDAGETRGILLEMRREIGDRTARTHDQLLHSQESLRVANLQMAAAMEELSLLFQFGRKLSAARNWDQVLRELLQNLADFVGCGGAALILRSAQGGDYAPRQTWQWEESHWDKVLVNLQDQVGEAMAESMMAPGIFTFAPHADTDRPGGRKVIVLPLEHQKVRLGYLLLLFGTTEERAAASEKFLPFLQTIQVMLAEEIASAQMLDRIRDLGRFNARVLGTVKSAIWVLDEAGQTVSCNRAGQEMLTGRPAAEEAPEENIFQIGRGRLENLVGPPEQDLPELVLDARLHLDDIDGLLLTGLREAPDGLFRGEGSISRSDGRRIPVLVQSSLMKGRNRQQDWLVVVCEDLRESRKLEIERLRADRLEGLVEMSATLAHEIRNPLMGLSGQAELLSESMDPDDDRRRYIEVITGEVDRINETITRMLNFVRPYEPSRQEVSMARLALDSVDLSRPRAEEKSVGLVLDFQGLAGEKTNAETWRFCLDGGQIKQVLLNLILNAIDAAPPSSVVSVSLRLSAGLPLVDAASGTQRSSPGLVIQVTDQGPGFPAEAVEKIFRPFYTTKNSGTGLGLSICRKIVAAHGGEIRARRREQTTVFEVLLPHPAATAEDRGSTTASAQKEQA